MFIDAGLEWVLFYGDSGQCGPSWAPVAVRCVVSGGGGAVVSDIDNTGNDNGCPFLPLLSCSSRVALRGRHRSVSAE